MPGILGQAPGGSPARLPVRAAAQAMPISHVSGEHIPPVALSDFGLKLLSCQAASLTG